MTLTITEDEILDATSEEVATREREPPGAWDALVQVAGMTADEARTAHLLALHVLDSHGETPAHWQAARDVSDELDALAEAEGIPRYGRGTRPAAIEVVDVVDDVGDVDTALVIAEGAILSGIGGAVIVSKSGHEGIWRTLVAIAGMPVKDAEAIASLGQHVVQDADEEPLHWNTFQRIVEEVDDLIEHDGFTSRWHH